MKIYVPSKKRDANIKAFNMITRIDKAKTLSKHISRDCKCKFNSKTYNSKQKPKNETCQCDCRNYFTCKRDHIQNPTK